MRIVTATYGHPRPLDAGFGPLSESKALPPENPTDCADVSVHRHQVMSGEVPQCSHATADEALACAGMRKGDAIWTRLNPLQRGTSADGYQWPETAYPLQPPVKPGLGRAG